MKLVSIIIPYFNKINYIKKTLSSVLNQTYKKIEILIIYDDKNIKDYNQILKLSRLDNRIKLIKNNKNLGAGISRNKGIKKSKGHYIAFIDADDYWKPTKLEKQINFMEKNKINFSHTSYYIVNNKNKIIGKRLSQRIIKYNDLLNSCDIGLSSVVILKNILNGMKFPSLKTKEDYVLWLKLSQKKIKIVGMKEKLMYWRKLEDSLSSKTFQKLKDGYFVYNKYLKFGKIYSLVRLIMLSLFFLRKKIDI